VGTGRGIRESLASAPNGIRRAAAFDTRIDLVFPGPDATGALAGNPEG
jgi:hypothetical protein